MIKGLFTVGYYVDDLDAAKKFYTSVLGFGPYFDEPFYVGFNVGGYELGLNPDPTGIVKGNSVGAYWGVDDIEDAMQKLKDLGAETATEITDVGGDIKIAAVKDPSGNHFGIIQNPHFKIEI
jgi:predicted enzyme related to lactoylglutathione lyase